MSFRVIKNGYMYIPKPPLIGKINFTGVIRNSDPDQSITGVLWESDKYAGYKITNVSVLFTPNNTGLYNNTIFGATYGNITAYLITINIELNNKHLVPSISTSTSLNLNGTNNAIVNQILPVQISITSSGVDLLYTVVIFGQDQLASNNLLETLFTTNPFNGLKTGLSFTLTYSY
jgi:hypothetical protein